MISRTHPFLAFILVAIGFLALTPLAHAATVSFAPPSGGLSAGIPFTVTVDLATQADSINAVSGSIVIPAGITITSVTTGNSLLQLWPQTPSYDVSNHAIEFTGGIPGSLPVNSSGTLFTFTGIATNAGSYTFSGSSINAYRADGKGTQIPLHLSDLVINVGTENKNAVVPATPTDKTAPVFTAVAIGHDASLFNNQYYATFFATDAGSGINYYEVQEGWFSPFVRADRYYVLHDQTLGTPITIRAVDNAGNIATKILPAEHPRSSFIVYIIAGILILAAGVFLVLRRR